MSKRFGRNQRRRAREQIAQLTATAGELLLEMDLKRRLIRDMRRRLEAAEQTITDAIEVLPRMCPAMPAVQLPMGGRPRPIRVEVSPPAPFLLGGPNADCHADLSFKTEMLQEMTAEVRHLNMPHEAHVLVKFDGGQWAYCLTRNALRSMGPRIAAERIANALAMMIAKELA